MRRLLLLTGAILATHLTLWAGGARDAAAAVLRWRTNGTNCNVAHSLAPGYSFGLAQHVGKSFFDDSIGNSVGTQVTCFIPTGRDLMELVPTNGRRLHSVNLRLEQFGPPGVSEATEARLVTSHHTAAQFCICDMKARSGGPGVFPLFLSYALCANDASCGTDWGVGVDLTMSDQGGGSPPAEKALKLRLLSAYSD
ncbi:MAG: hypothetical protein KF718_19335 [Polyangiaceae bacterium]|nr:hypothetical protein [Polyangiaceae bacterium]